MSWAAPLARDDPKEGTDMHRSTVLVTPTYTLLSAGPSRFTVAPTPTDAWAGGLDGLAAKVGKLFKGEGVMLLDGAAARAVGLAPDEHWRTVVPTSGLRVYVGQLGGLWNDECPLLDESWSQGCTVASFDLFAELAGASYHRSPGVAGLSLLKSLYPLGKTKPVGWETDGPEGAYEAAYFPDDWSAKVPGRYLHGYDKRRSGLAALNVLEVARQQLAHKPGASYYDPTLCGWWLCEVPAWNDPRIPDPAGYGVDRTKKVRWLTNPTIDHLNRLAELGKSEGVRFVREAWVAPKSRLFKGWADRVEQGYQKADAMRSARVAGGQPSDRAMDADRVADTLKAMYRETPGMWASPTSTVKRPDWFAAKLARERVNAWWVAWTVGQETGRWPSYVDGDKWWYADDQEDATKAVPAGLALGNKLGQWRHDGTKEQGR